MLSQLGPLFKATFRHAEESDARQNLPHDVNKDGRRKDEDDLRDNNDMWEDSTGVSVAALRAFLINFLAGTSKQTGLAQTAGTAPNATSPGPQAGAESPIPQTSPPVNSMTARAAGAYQSMADRLDPHPPVVTGPAAGDAPRTDADLVAAADIRLIHALIADLEILEQGGADTLTLEPAESFLQSLKNAVDKSLGR